MSLFKSKKYPNQIKDKKRPVKYRKKMGMINRAMKRAHEAQQLKSMGKPVFKKATKGAFGHNKRRGIPGNKIRKAIANSKFNGFLNNGLAWGYFRTKHALI